MKEVALARHEFDHDIYVDWQADITGAWQSLYGGTKRIGVKRDPIDGLGARFAARKLIQEIGRAHV